MKSASEYHEEFWAFSLERYGRDGVSELCLELQESCRADVNITLFCLWRGQHRHAIDAPTMTALIEGEAGQWHRDVVLLLRAARKSMKQRTLAGNGEIVESLRNDVKRVEIESERLEQFSLAGVLAALPSQALASAGDGRSAREISLANTKHYVEAIAPYEVDTVAAVLKSLTEKCVRAR